jgi:hypothetical protein
MNRIHQLIQELKKRPDVGIVEREHVWLAVISKGRDFICEVTIPHNVMEWHACVKHRHEKKEVWSDWMDYTGYDDRAGEELTAEMLEDILMFINRVSISELQPPFRIYQEKP